MAAATRASIFGPSTQPFVSTRSTPATTSTNASPSGSNSLASAFIGASLPRVSSPKNRRVWSNSSVTAAAAAAVTATPTEEIKEHGFPLSSILLPHYFGALQFVKLAGEFLPSIFKCYIPDGKIRRKSASLIYVLPTWAAFELGRAPVFWKTTNGLPPTSGEKLRLFYNPAAKKLVPNEDFGIAFNGGFNQPIMCGGEPRAMLKKTRGLADRPIFTIQICIPKHAMNLIFSFTNGVDWDGPYRLQFQVPKAMRNKPIDFFNEGLAEELSKDGACERAIFPDTNIAITRCAVIGNLATEGGDRCDLNLVPGCLDTSSPSYNPDANVDDGSCPIDSDIED